MIQTFRFNIRPDPNGGSEFCFQAVDGMTGAAVASGMRRGEAEIAYVAKAGQHSRSMVARAAMALDELREELAQMDRVIAEQQARIGQLRTLFPNPDDDPG